MKSLANKGKPLINPKKKKTIDLLIHFGTCDFCNKRNIRISHFNYSQQERWFASDGIERRNIPEPYRLCGKCLVKGLILLTYRKGEQHD